MDIPIMNPSSLEIRTPTQHCLSLIKQADEMLDQIQKSKEKKPKKKSVNNITPEFLKAVQSLSTRFKSYNKNEITTRPVPSLVEKIGPGSYYVARSFTPTVIQNNYLIEKINFKQNNSINSPNFIEKNKSLQKNDYFVKQHNMKVMNVLDTRIIEQQRVNQKNRIRFMEKSGVPGNWRMKKKYKRICECALLLMTNLSICTTIKCRINNRKRLRERSDQLLSWLVGVLRIVGKIQKNLRRIRKRVAYKNIIMVALPVQKFILKARKAAYTVLIKALKRIQSMNLLFLLYSKWKGYIEMVQKQYRTFVAVKKARIKALVYFFDRYGEGCKMWNAFKILQKKEFVERFLMIKSWDYSRVMCKYHSDHKQVMRGFKRNMFFMEGNANSEFGGRKVNFGKQKKPVFNIFTNRVQALDYLMSYEKVIMKKYEQKGSKFMRKATTIRKR